MNNNTDKGLQGNEKIEEAIAGLQKETTQEMLAHALTVIRRRMKEGGQLIIAVEPPKGDDQKGGGSVKSTFLTDIDKLFETALRTDGIEGVILNPWNRTIMLDKLLIKIILGKNA